MSGATQMQTPTPAVAEDLDTFNNNTPMDSPIDVNSQGQGLDTFDEMLVNEPLVQQEVDDGIEAKASETEELDDTPIKTLSDSEDKAEESEEGAEKAELDAKSEEEVADKGAEDSEGDGEELAAEKPKGPTIRVKEGDRALDINPEEATVPVKVNGKKQFVPMRELMDNYSGKVSYDEKFAKFDEERSEFGKSKEVYEGHKQELSQHMGKIGKLIQQGAKGEANPLESLRYLVDMSGVNVVDYEKQMMEYLSEEVDVYNGMDDVERDLYWKTKENEHLKNSQATQLKQVEERKTHQGRLETESKVREQYGVSREQYGKAQEELAQNGFDVENATPENICKYLAFEPFAVKAGELCEQFSDELGDDDLGSLVTEVTRTLYEYQSMSETQALKLAASKLGYEVEDVAEEIEKLNTKVIPREAPTSKKGKVAAQTERPETFDDFEETQYR